MPEPPLALKVTVLADRRSTGCRLMGTTTRAWLPAPPSSWLRRRCFRTVGAAGALEGAVYACSIALFGGATVLVPPPL